MALSRYDLLLVAWAFPLLAGLVVGHLLPGSFIEALATSAVVAALLVGNAVFVDNPVQPEPFSPASPGAYSPA